MGIEQGTPVVGFNSELLHHTDLQDLRLFRAFKCWDGFKTTHQQQIENIGNLSLQELISLSGQLSNSINEAIGIGIEKVTLDPLNEEKVILLNDFLSGVGSRIVFMRHGEQSPPEWIFSISHPGVRKIRMMQNPFNKEDLLTNKGLAEIFAVSLVFLHIQAKTGKKVRILSSENMRALELAEMVATVIEDSSCTTNEGLSCITYKDERDHPPVTVEQILEDLPLGAMPWDPQLVDKWCKNNRSGKKQSESIISTVEHLYKLGTDKDGNELLIVLTHTQQLAETLKLTGKLVDPYIRFPELTMIAIKDVNNPLVLRKGIFSDKPTLPRKDMRRVLENLGDGYEWYRIRRAEYESDEKIPFLVSPEPLHLTFEEGKEINRIGKDVVDFMHAADELYRSEGDVKELLDRGKPKIFLASQLPRYLFFRPDLIITRQGFSICEIETSPFGLALAELLNRAYRSEGFDTMVTDEVLRRFLVTNTPHEGTIIYSQNTSSYAGQLQFLAKELFSTGDRKWEAEQVDFALGRNSIPIYRGFYLYEYLNNLFVNNLIETVSAKGDSALIIPSLTPHMEEKALLALIWDRRWEPFLKRQLGIPALEHLKRVVPPTWIVGEERFFAPGLPGGVVSSEDLASLSKSRRNFVLKKSGFGSGSSWAEGVNFLQEKSAARAGKLLGAAKRDTSSLYIIQEFRAASERPLVYQKDSHTLAEMQARIRLTPYFSMVNGNEGELIAIKATGCEDTNYIHASTGSINTAVA